MEVAEGKKPGCGCGWVGRTELLLLPSESGGTVLNTEGPFFCPYRAFSWSLNLLLESPGIPGLTPLPLKYCLHSIHDTTQQFQGVSESGGKGQPDSFLLETAVGTFRASGSFCASQIGLLVSWKSFSSELKEEG